MRIYVNHIRCVSDEPVLIGGGQDVLYRDGRMPDQMPQQRPCWPPQEELGVDAVARAVFGGGVPGQIKACTPKSTC